MMETLQIIAIAILVTCGPELLFLLWMWLAALVAAANRWEERKAAERRKNDPESGY